MHGKTDQIHHDGAASYAALPCALRGRSATTRSALERDTLPAALEVDVDAPATARSMGVRHRAPAATADAARRQSQIPSGIDPAPSTAQRATWLARELTSIGGGLPRMPAPGGQRGAGRPAQRHRHRPTAAMREAMAEAEVGDDVYGEDPTVNRLEERVAELLGKEAALFVPSGTWPTRSRCVATRSAATRASSAQRRARLALRGRRRRGARRRQLQPLEHGADGVARPARRDARDPARRRALRAARPGLPREHPQPGGGAGLSRADVRGVSRPRGARPARSTSTGRASSTPPWPPASLRRGRRAVARHGPVLPVQGAGRAGRLDGRRLDARPWRGRAAFRKMLGGGMRQAGVIAAAGLLALTDDGRPPGRGPRQRRRLAAGLAGLPGLRVQVPQTNIVFVDVEGERAQTLLPHLKSRGILATGLCTPALRHAPRCRRCRCTLAPSPPLRELTFDCLKAQEST